MIPETKYLRDKDKLREYALARYGVDADIPCVAEDWFCDFETSVSVEIWVNNRLQEAGVFKAGQPKEPGEDDLFFVNEGKAFIFWRHLQVVRSKIFNTNLLPNPINITATKVSILCHSE